MILKEIKNELAIANHPIAKALHKTAHSKVLAIGLKKGMILKEHQAHLPTKIFVLEGEIIYKENDCHATLYQYYELEIPTNVLHSIEATSDSLCLLTQG